MRFEKNDKVRLKPHLPSIVGLGRDRRGLEGLVGAVHDLAAKGHRLDILFETDDRLCGVSGHQIEKVKPPLRTPVKDRRCL